MVRDAVYGVAAPISPGLYRIRRIGMEGRPNRRPLISSSAAAELVAVTAIQRSYARSAERLRDADCEDAH